MGEAEDLLKERVEESHSPFDRYVSVTMAILAVLLAADSLFSHRAHTEELLNQAQASDQWAYYQAKSIRRAMYEMGGELTKLTNAPASPETQAVATAFKNNVAKYEKDGEAIQEQARDLEKERDLFSKRANRYDLAEIFFEIAIVACSLAILTKRREMWLASIALGAVGAVVALTVLRLT